MISADLARLPQRCTALRTAGAEGSRDADRAPLAIRCGDRNRAGGGLQGRTGLSGRGLLGKFGPNHAADTVVTRWAVDAETGSRRVSPSGGPVMEFVGIRRKDTGEWALPGGMVDNGETISTTMKREFVRQLSWLYVDYFGLSSHGGSSSTSTHHTHASCTMLCQVSPWLTGSCLIGACNPMS